MWECRGCPWVEAEAACCKTSTTPLRLHLYRGVLDWPGILRDKFRMFFVGQGLNKNDRKSYTELFGKPSEQRCPDESACERKKDL